VSLSEEAVRGVLASPAPPTPAPRWAGDPLDLRNLPPVPTLRDWFGPGQPLYLPPYLARLFEERAAAGGDRLAEQVVERLEW
jgi:hypothetical protein